MRDALAPGAFFVANDVIVKERSSTLAGGSPLHRAPILVQNCQALVPLSPPGFRRYEDIAPFADWDCFGGRLRRNPRKDVLPLLIERFSFHVFVGYGNAIDPFVDRGFGPNFDAPRRRGIARSLDCVHACATSRALLAGYLTPTHVMAVMAREPAEHPYYARGLSPEASRCGLPSAVVTPEELEAADRALSMYFDVPPVAPDDGAYARLPLVGCVAQRGAAGGGYDDGWGGGDAPSLRSVPERDVSRFTACTRHRARRRRAGYRTERCRRSETALRRRARRGRSVRLDSPGRTALRAIRNRT